MAYQFVATDGASIFAAQTLTAALSSTTILSVLKSSGGVFAETRYAPVLIFPYDLHYGAGYIVLSGATNSGFHSTEGAFIYRRDVSTPSDPSAYFTGAYSSTGLIGMNSLAPYEAGGQIYLIAALYGIGDLFTLAQPASIPALSTYALIALVLAMAAMAVARLR